jgi:hypothetical protein
MSGQKPYLKSRTWISKLRGYVRGRLPDGRVCAWCVLHPVRLFDCAICRDRYHHFWVPDHEWCKLPTRLINKHLCPSCYCCVRRLTALCRRLGTSLASSPRSSRSAQKPNGWSGFDYPDERCYELWELPNGTTYARCVDETQCERYRCDLCRAEHYYDWLVRNRLWAKLPAFLLDKWLCLSCFCCVRRLISRGCNLGDTLAAHPASGGARPQARA